MSRVNFDSYTYALYNKRYNTRTNAGAVQLYNDLTRVASLYFNYDTVLANRSPVLSGSRVIVYYHMSMLDTVVEMLRNEDSVYLYYNIGTGLAYLNTGKEEVGEEES